MAIDQCSPGQNHASDAMDPLFLSKMTNDLARIITDVLIRYRENLLKIREINNEAG